MRLLILVDDPPWPTNSGNRALLAQDLGQLQASGHELEVVIFHHRSETRDAMRRTRSGAPDAHLVARQGLLRATLTAPLTPYQAASRRLPDPLLERLRATGFDAVVAEHEWTLPAAHAVAGPSRTPVVLRSHNDEVAFMAAFAARAVGLHGLYARAEAARTSRRWVRRITRDCAQVWTLTLADAATYERLDTRVVPPAIEPISMVQRDRVDALTVGFLGALDIPHAVDGLRWMLREVWPRVLQDVPQARFQIAGRRASRALANELAGHANVDFHGEVFDADQFVADQRIFVNPAFAGSGVNMKLTTPAALGIPIVSTTFGLRGFEALGTAVPPADDAVAFAARLVSLLEEPSTLSAATAATLVAVQAYSPDSVGRAIENELSTLTDGLRIRPAGR